MTTSNPPTSPTSPSSDIVENSPLNEVDPASLNELMARDPLELSSQDITQIVDSLRAQRARWEAGETTKVKKAPAKKKLSKEESAKLLENLELDL